jgi:phage terminase large subunit GpA-like protein
MTALLREAERHLRASPRLIDFAAAHRRVGGRKFDLAGHEYLRGLYLDENPQMVIRKAAQMGATEYAITRALHFAAVKGGCSIYFFPSGQDVDDFSRDRFGPAVQESPYLAGLVRDTNTMGLKHIGRGSIYLRGTQSTAQLKSVPADFLIFDELDEMKAPMIELARKRLGHSAYGWELALSTPTFPEYGIDAAFLETDQRFWMLHCPGCGRDWCLEELFLEHHGSPQDPRSEICFIQGRPGAEELVCLKCGHRLDPAQGIWVPKYDCPSHGYHLSKFGLDPIPLTL